MHGARVVLEQRDTVPHFRLAASPLAPADQLEVSARHDLLLEHWTDIDQADPARIAPHRFNDVVDDAVEYGPCERVVQVGDRHVVGDIPLAGIRVYEVDALTPEAPAVPLHVLSGRVHQSL